MTFDRYSFRREPTAEEVEAASTEIQKHEVAITALQERIQALMSEAQQLKKLQMQHHQHINRCKGVVTLARRLPIEVLAKIFEHCVEDGWTRAPIVVSHVCSLWRRAARFPGVWSCIYVNCDSVDAVGRTRFWLSNARQVPLDIIITASARAWAPNIIEVLDLLLEHASQWKTLTLQTDTSRQTHLILSRCTRPMTNLEALSITTEISRIATADNDSDTIELMDQFSAERAPKLSQIFLTCDILPINLSFPSHIRHLVLSILESALTRPLSAAPILDILETLPGLEHLTLSLPLSGQEIFVPSPSPDRCVTLHRLTALTFYGPTDQNGLLAHFHTPNLRRLCLRSLEDIGYRQEPIGPSLLRFLQTSAPPLEHLELYDIDLSPEHFAPCFAALPNLRELRLHECSISETTLQLLNGPHGLCRRLSRIDLRWCGQLSGKAIVNLVRSRKLDDGQCAFSVDQDVADSISEVAVINCPFVEEQDVLELARMAVCRLVVRDTDFCYTRQCCANMRYRQRLQLRHLHTTWAQEKDHIRFIM